MKLLSILLESVSFVLIAFVAGIVWLLFGLAIVVVVGKVIIWIGFR